MTTPAIIEANHADLIRLLQARLAEVGPEDPDDEDWGEGADVDEDELGRF